VGGRVAGRTGVGKDKWRFIGCAVRGSFGGIIYNVINSTAHIAEDIDGNT